MTKRIVTLGLILAAVLLASGCGSGKSSVVSANPGEVVATIGEVKITDAELTDAVKGRLKQVDQQVYEIKKDGLDDLIDQKLIKQAADKQSKSVDDFLKENINDKITMPSDDEIKSFYDARKDQMGGKKFEEAKETIKNFLVQSRTQAQRQQLLAGLRAASNVKIDLEPPRADVEAGDNPSKGPSGAKVTLVEFTDYQCPYCSRIRPTVNRIMEEYKDKVRYVLRDFPLSFHDKAKKAHEAAHCAGDQDKYWEYNQKLWENQQNLDVPKLKEYAKGLGLNAEKFNKCLDSGKYTKKVEENAEYGAKVGVSGTPTFFINGMSAGRSYADFKQLIDMELKR